MVEDIPVAGPGSVVVRLRVLLPSLTAGQQRAARFVLDHVDRASEFSIGQLAEAAGVSQATVVRLATALGYTGYRDFRLALARSDGARAQRAEGEREIAADITRYDEAEQVVAKLLAAEQATLHDTAGILDPDQLRSAAGCIASARRVVAFGVGASGIVARDLAAKLERIGIIAQAATEQHAALTTVTVLDERDVLVAISVSGGTVDVLEAFAEARRRGVGTIGLTGDPSSVLGQASHVLLTTSVGEGPLRSAAMASRVSQMFAVDVLFTLVAQLRYEDAAVAIENSYHLLRRKR